MTPFKNLDDKKRAAYWTSGNLRQDGTPYDPVLETSVWANAMPGSTDGTTRADQTFYGPDKTSFLNATDALAKGNKCAVLLELSGFVVHANSIKPRWTVVQGVVTQRGGAYTQALGGMFGAIAPQTDASASAAAAAAANVDAFAFGAAVANPPPPPPLESSATWSTQQQPQQPPLGGFGSPLHDSAIAASTGFQ